MRAISAVRKVDEVRCFSPNPARREAFAREMHALTGISMVACASPQAAVQGADVVLCATNSSSPVFFADWIEPGVHLSTVQHAELHLDVFKAADLLVTHYAGRPAMIESSRGIVHAENTETMRRAVRAAIGENLPNLHDLVLGNVPGRSSSAQVTAFLNYVGLGYQFAAVGALVHRNARKRGIGRDLPTDWFTEDVNP